MVSLNKTATLWSKRLTAHGRDGQSTRCDTADGPGPNCCFFLCNICCYVIC